MSIRDRFDNWINTMTGLGGLRDKAAGTRFQRRRRLSREQLTALFEQSSIFARVCTRLAADSLRNGWEIEDIDADVDLPSLMSDLDDLGVNQALRLASTWERLYGGAVIAMPVFDGRSPDQALDLSAISQVMPFQVIAADDARPLETDVGFGSPTYLKTLAYDITGLSSRGSIRVHHSRVIPFEAIPLPPEVLAQHSPNGWGPSVLERMYESVSRSGAAHAHASSILFAVSIFVLKMKGFRDAHTSAGGRKKLKEFLQDFSSTLSSLGVAGIDAEDALENVSHSLAGIPEIIDRLDARVVADGDMPKEILFNESPAGLNAGELSGPQELWFGVCADYQRDRLTPAINRMLEVVFAWKKIPATRWTIKWAPLWTKSDAETSATAKTNAETDNLYYQMGAVSSEEIRAHRFEQRKMGPLELSGPGEAPALDLSGEVAAYEQAVIAPTPAEQDAPTPADQAAPTPAEQDAPTPADQAMNGAQIASLMQVVQAVNTGELPRDAAVGILGVAFPSIRGREHTVLGSAGLQPVAAAPTGAPEPEPETDEPDVAPPSVDPPPEDLTSPREAAERFGVPTRTITRAIETGALRYWGLGSHKRVSFADVARLARSHEVPDDAA